MDREKLFRHLAYIIFFILIINFFANKFYWYFSIWYFDIIMHFLGGFWVGLVFLYFFMRTNLSPRSILTTLLFVLFMGVGWEVFEFYFFNYIARNPFNILDTGSDIFFDLAGGAFAVFYFLKRIMSVKQSAVQ